MKKKTAICRVEVAKLKHKKIKEGTTPWELKPKGKLYSKMNNRIIKPLYNWIMHHTQVVRSTILNYYLKVNIYGHITKNCSKIVTGGLCTRTS